MKIPESLPLIRRIGLTGSMGTGKTTAADAFRRLGLGVVDADAVAREVVAAGTPGLAEVVKAFGPAVLTPDGMLDRAALAAKVFTDNEGRKRLEAIVHPLVEEEAERRLAAILTADPDAIAVYDVPLLFETGLESKYDLTVVVATSRDAQFERIKARSGLSGEEVESRLGAQMPLAEKVRRADVTLENNGTPAELLAKAADLVKLIREHNRKKG